MDPLLQMPLDKLRVDVFTHVFPLTPQVPLVFSRILFHLHAL